MSILADEYWPSASRQFWLRTQRLYYVDPSENPSHGWYFKVRGPRCFGPFQSRREADKVLKRIVSSYMANNITDGR